MRRTLLWAVLSAVCAASVPAVAQQAQGAPPPPAAPQPGRTAAPIDLAGTWVSVITEDWQWRFVTPIVGDYTSVPLNSEGDKLARAWNHEADVKAGQACKAFGAAAIMRLPTRMQVSWADDNTLKLDWDLGTQSRLVTFDEAKQPGARTLQGHAVAEWIDLPPPARGRGAGAAPAAGAAGGRGGAPEGAAGRGAAPTSRAGGLKIVTTNLSAQYLRQNGVPISEKAVVTDYLDTVPGPGGSQWLVVKTIVEDPAYMSQPYITSAQFRKEANAAKWSPTPCELLPRLKGTATQVPRSGGE